MIEREHVEESGHGDVCVCADACGEREIGVTWNAALLRASATTKPSPSSTRAHSMRAILCFDLCFPVLSCLLCVGYVR